MFIFAFVVPVEEMELGLAQMLIVVSEIWDWVYSPTSFVGKKKKKYKIRDLGLWLDQIAIYGVQKKNIDYKISDKKVSSSEYKALQ